MAKIDRQKVGNLILTTVAGGPGGRVGKFGAVGNPPQATADERWARYAFQRL